MIVTGFPTSSDIYLEVDGKKVAVVQSYAAKTSRSSRTVEAFGEDQPVATIPGPRSHLVELTRLYATDEAVRDGINFHDLEDFSLVILRLPVERHRGKRHPGRHGGGKGDHCGGQADRDEGVSMERDWMTLLAGARRTAAEEGQGLELRLLSAREVLEARREAAGLTREDRERALCANACLLARALERGGEPVFSTGGAVLEGLSVEQIASLSRQWSAFNRRENPSPEEGEPEVHDLKKAWSTRLMRAFSGACSGLLGRCPPSRGPGR